MYTKAPNIYEMLDTLSLEMKEELVEYLKADIAAAKAAPKKSYLEEQWAEIMRLMNVLDYEPLMPLYLRRKKSLRLIRMYDGYQSGFYISLQPALSGKVPCQLNKLGCLSRGNSSLNE